MDVPKALRRAADVEARQKSGAPEEDPRSFPALMDRVAVAIAASLRSEVCYASVDNSALLQRARQNARTALGKALLEGKEHP
jgi:alkylhydroperoxidase family enzyme